MIPFGIWLANARDTEQLIRYPPLEVYVIDLIKAEPGDWWISKLCRWLNEYDESRRSIIHCGLCKWYANQRKRARAARYRHQYLLPGIDSHPWALHTDCDRSLSMLCAMMRRLDKRGVIERRREIIPDIRQPRGYDWGTRLH